MNTYRIISDLVRDSYVLDEIIINKELSNQLKIKREWKKYHHKIYLRSVAVSFAFGWFRPFPYLYKHCSKFMSL